MNRKCTEDFLGPWNYSVECRQGERVTLHTCPDPRSGRHREWTLGWALASEPWWWVSVAYSVGTKVPLRSRALIAGEAAECVGLSPRSCCKPKASLKTETYFKNTTMSFYFNLSKKRQEENPTLKLQPHGISFTSTLRPQPAVVLLPGLQVPFSSPVPLRCSVYLQMHTHARTPRHTQSNTWLTLAFLTWAHLASLFTVSLMPLIPVTQQSPDNLDGAYVTLSFKGLVGNAVNALR